MINSDAEKDWSWCIDNQRTFSDEIVYVEQYNNSPPYG